MTQKQRILNLLKQKRTGGVAVYELTTPRPNGLGIAQYNARIYDLRNEGYEIESREGKFYLISEPKEPEYEWIFKGNTARKVIV